jgi:hypothetical protein
LPWNWASERRRRHVRARDERILADAAADAVNEGRFDAGVAWGSATLGAVSASAPLGDGAARAAPAARAARAARAAPRRIPILTKEPLGEVILPLSLFADGA